MSWILIAVIAIFVICGYTGWRKGIIRIAVSVAAMIITIIAAVFAAPLLGNFVKKNTTLYDKLNESVYTALAKSDMFNNAINKNISENQNFTYSESQGNVVAYVTGVVGMLNIPESITQQMNSVVSDDYINGVIKNENATVKEVVTQVVADRLTDIIFHTLMYAIVFAVVLAVLRIVMVAFGLISRLLVIHQANSLGGLAFGLVEGLIFVWLLFMVLTVFESTDWASKALSDISSNKFLEFIYNHNLILKSTFRSL